MLSNVSCNKNIARMFSALSSDIRIHNFKTKFIKVHRKISRSFLSLKKKVKKSLWLKLSSAFFSIQVSRAWPNPDMRRHNEGYAKESVSQKGQYLFKFELKSLSIIFWLNRIFFLSFEHAKINQSFKILFFYWSTFKFWFSYFY